VTKVIYPKTEAPGFEAEAKTKAVDAETEAKTEAVEAARQYINKSHM